MGLLSIDMVRIYSLLIFTLLLHNWSIAQNLVPNPGFDDLTDCPYDGGQISFAYPWVSATNGTPDLFNECSTEPHLMVPYAGGYIDGYQLQKSGTGYAGIYVYTDANPFIPECIEVQLIDKLKKDVKYYLEFFVSPDISPMNYYGYTDAVGLALSDTFFYKDISANISLLLNPTIENRGMLVTDTAGWTRVSGCYTAKGGEAFAIIGNLRGKGETIVELINPTFPYLNYFFIEDVFIGTFDPLPDTLLLCDGQPVTLNAAFLDATYLWNTGETDSTTLIQNAGIYTVEANMEKCVLRDTVVVLDTREMGGLQSDTTICSDEPIKLAVPLPGSYLWSDGSTGRELEVSETGSYSVTITNDCGQFPFSTHVEALDCGCWVYVPTAISPNGDGINDELTAYFGCDYDYRILRFAVFDRWGGQVYTSGEGEATIWDGSARGKPMPPGTYTWFLEYETLRNGKAERHIEKGEVNVIR
jgi:gliding motility-associated-like protein